jgi:hypothetical protein
MCVVLIDCQFTKAELEFKVDLWNSMRIQAYISNDLISDTNPTRKDAFSPCFSD